MMSAPQAVMIGGILTLVAGCSAPRKVELTGSLTENLLALDRVDPVDVVVLPVRDESSAGAPVKILEERIRSILLDKCYSVLSREAVAAHTNLAESSPVSAAYTPGACAEDAVMEIVLKRYEPRPRAPHHSVTIVADLRLIATDEQRTVLWEYANARAEVRTDGYPESTLPQEKVGQRAMLRFIDKALARLPEKGPLQESGTNLMG